MLIRESLPLVRWPWGDYKVCGCRQGKGEGEALLTFVTITLPRASGPCRALGSAAVVATGIGAARHGKAWQWHGATRIRKHDGH